MSPVPLPRGSPQKQLLIYLPEMALKACTNTDLFFFFLSYTNGGVRFHSLFFFF